VHLPKLLSTFTLGGWQKVAAITLATSVGVTGAVVQVARQRDAQSQTVGFDVRGPGDAADLPISATADPTTDPTTSADENRTADPATEPSGIDDPLDLSDDAERLPGPTNVPLPTDLPDVLPTAKPAPSAVEGPGFCDGVDDMLEKSRAAREHAAKHADQDPRAGRLGEVLPIDSPYEGWHAAYHGEVTVFDMTNSPRQGRDTAQMFQEHGFTGGYDRGWQGKGAANTNGEGAVEFYVYEFASTDDALAFHERSLRNACQDTKHTFTIPDLPSVVGLSLRLSFPEFQEEASYVLGPRVYFVPLSQDHHDEGYHRVVELLRMGRKVAR
jgi:hypothetical protein